MDRIYYFMLAEEMGSRKKCKGTQDQYLPVFQNQTPMHHVYYLQMRESVSKDDLPSVQTYMEKALERMGKWYDETQLTHTYRVYSPAFENWLRTRGYDTIWQQWWKLPLYGEYKESSNLNILLQKIPGDRYPRNLLILGEAPGVYEWLPKLARGMKTVTFCGENKPRAFARVGELLLDEYGLLAEWKKDLCQYRGVEALVLDYCGREKLYVWAVGQGSVWIDMTSMECRRHAIEDRNTGIYYVSLKSIWREEILQTLDTANKIKYNTGVILEGKVGL